jgi:hypothetical protein
MQKHIREPDPRFQSPPRAVLRRAEAEHLGSWLYGSPLPEHVWGCVLMTTLLILGLGGLALTLRPSPFSALCAILCLLLLYPMIIYVIDKRISRIDIFSNGFLWKNIFSLNVFRWEEIGTIRRGTWRNATDGQPEGIKDIDTITVKHRNGQYFVISDLSKLYRHMRARLCDTIESQFVAVRLPEALRHYYDGKTLDFETFVLSRDGLWRQGDFLPWSRVERLEIGPERLLIRSEGRTSDWFCTPLPEQPNACLLKALIEAIRMGDVRAGP